MKYLHTMVRVNDLTASLKFYTEIFGLVEARRIENEKARYTLVFLVASEDVESFRAGLAPALELTYNWETEDYGTARNFGHLAYEVDNIYDFCAKLQKAGITINRPPRDGNMAFVRSPDLISIEILQKGDPLPPAEPWLSMQNTGVW